MNTTRQPSTPERVCLVDMSNRPIGECLKATVHGYSTPLHRAFSIFLFDDRDRLLLQQRSRAKITWPGVWSNSCCGHPAPGEETAAAAVRRLREELGLGGGELFEAVPDFRYRTRFREIEENEICPVFIGRVSGLGPWNRSELETVAWLDWAEFIRLADAEPAPPWGEFSPWSRWESQRLAKLGSIRSRVLSDLQPFQPLQTHAHHIPA